MGFEAEKHTARMEQISQTHDVHRFEGSKSPVKVERPDVLDILHLTTWCKNKENTLEPGTVTYVSDESRCRLNGFIHLSR